MTGADVRAAIDAVWRIESPRLIAGLTRIVRDVGLAEDLAQDALLAALEQWPRSGVPDRPGAWLMSVAKRRAIDGFRQDALHGRKHEELGRELDARHETVTRELDDALDDPVGDDLLRLVFMTCHPVLSTEARLALTLRLLGGLTTEEIARAFLVHGADHPAADRAREAHPEGGARAVRGAARRGALRERLASVLDVIYLIFNEGYAATAGDDWMRPGLCEDALRLGRILAELAPVEPEVHGLVALMEIQASRLRARTAADGEPVLLLEQDRGRWDYLLINRGLAALARAESLGGALGPYRAAGGDRRLPRPGAPRRRHRLGAHRRALRRARPARALAGGGAEPRRRRVDGLRSRPRVCRSWTRCARSRRWRSYHLLPAVRGDLLRKLGREEEARAEFARAAELTRNERERRLLLERAEGAA